jgi:hypothetical protein
LSERKRILVPDLSIDWDIVGAASLLVLLFGTSRIWERL